MALKDLARSTLRKAGFTFRRFPTSLDQCLARTIFLKHSRIDVVLDVGANVGQYGSELREMGYTGRIISFEPVKASFDLLQEKARNHPTWSVRHSALGAEEGQSTINVAHTMSSLLPKKAGGDDTVKFDYERTETIQIAKLDNVWSQLLQPNERVFLKMDVQGFEMHVLRGAVESLPRVLGVEVELSLTEVYAGQASFDDVYGHLNQNGFRLRQVWSHGVNPTTGRMADCDGIFERIDSSAA